MNEDCTWLVYSGILFCFGKVGIQIWISFSERHHSWFTLKIFFWDKENANLTLHSSTSRLTVIDSASVTKQTMKASVRMNRNRLDVFLSKFRFLGMALNEESVCFHNNFLFRWTSRLIIDSFSFHYQVNRIN